MRAIHIGGKIGARPPWSDPWSAWPRLHRTHLAPLATQFSLHLRWLAVVIALSSYFVGPPTQGAVPLALLIAGFTGILYLGYWRGWRPPIVLAAVADILFISLLVLQRGGAVSESYLLYAIPIFYLGLHYAWPGAVLGGILAGLIYALTLLLGGVIEPPPPTFDIDSRIVIRGLYLAFATLVVSFVAQEQERNQRRLERLHLRSREQVRRLEAIQRITQKLNTVPTGADVARVIVEETQGVIGYKNCRVHRIEEQSDGAGLVLAAFYGQHSDEESTIPANAWKLRVGEGITGWTALYGKPVLVADASQDPRARHLPGTREGPSSLLAVPLLSNRRVKGVITFSQDGADAFSADDLNLMVTLANAAATALDNIESRESLAQQARTDSVTGLPHHGAFLSALREALRESERSGGRLALALLDIDGFRSYNERMGLAAGDEALRHVGACVSRACCSVEEIDGATGAGMYRRAAPTAECFRVGGDEFALLLRGPLAEMETARRLVRACIHTVNAAGKADALRRVTISAGLAFYPVDANTGRKLREVAEAALYLVKQTGGNRLGQADAAAKETLQLRRRLDEMVRASLAESGSANVVQQLVAEAANLTQHAHHATLAEQLTTEALRALAAAIDAKDDYTRGHSERVAAAATEIARYLGLPGAVVDNITTAARMHDIGKIGVPDHILHKRGALNPLEQAIVAAHPEIGADILSPISTLRDLVPIVRHHHEHWDGKGYPQGLAGEAIPIGARVIAVADTIDAMVTDRPYRRGLHITAALDELRKWAGTHYDPQVVEAAVALYASGRGLALYGVMSAGVPAEPTAPPVQIAGTVLDLAMYPEPVSVPARFAARRRPRDGADGRAGGQG